MSMQQSTAASPSASSRAFAGVLAAIATPGEKRPPARDLDGLEDDIATLSYEQALRSRARFQSPPPAGAPPRDSAPETGPDAAHALSATHSPVNSVKSSPVPVPAAVNTPVPTQRSRKVSSVTVRLSAAESDQLRLRAAEAGLTVSAYLRSCAFEVEALRAEVKSTLAQFRNPPVSSASAPRASALPPAPWRRFWHLVSRRKPATD
jgi:hypothetical protein